MSSNDITGARLVSKANTKEYEDNYDRIFGKKKVIIEDEAPKCERCVVYIDDEEVEND